MFVTSVFPYLFPPNISKMERRRDIKGLVDALNCRPLFGFNSEKSAELGCLAATALGRVGDPIAVEPLLDLLSGPDQRLQVYAVRALGELRDPRAVDPLLRILEAHAGRDSREPPQSNALILDSIEALEKIGDVRAAKSIVKVLWRAKLPAARTLGRLGAADAIDALVDLLSVETQEIRAVSAAKRFDPPYLDLRDAVATSLKQLRWTPTPDAVGAMYCISLGDGARCARLGAAIVPFLLEMLKHEERWKAQLEVEKRYSKGGTSRLEQLIRDAWEARWALRKVNDPACMGLLVAALATHPNQLEEILCALGQMKDERAVPSLLGVLTNQNLEPVAAALKDIGLPNVLSSLLALLRDDNFERRSVAAKVLNVLGWAPYPSPDGVAFCAAQRSLKVCLEWGTSAVDPCMTLLRDHLHQVRQFAVEALGQLKDPLAVGPLIEALSDDSDEVKSSAATALGSIGGLHAIGALELALRAPRRSVRRAAAQALDELGWRPGQNASGAAYWLAKRRLADCIAAQHSDGLHEMLASVLFDEDLEFSIEVARAIVGIDWAVEDRIDLLLRRLFAIRTSDESQLILNGFGLMVKEIAAPAPLTTEIIDSILRVLQVPSIIKTENLGNFELKDAIAAWREGSLTQLRGLCANPAKPIGNLLHLFAATSNIQLPYLHIIHSGKSIDGEIGGTCTLDFDQHRSMAREELVSRGNPEYQLSHFRP